MVYSAYTPPSHGLYITNIHDLNMLQCVMVKPITSAAASKKARRKVGILVNYAEGGATEAYCSRAVCPSVCLLQAFLAAR